MKNFKYRNYFLIIISLALVSIHVQAQNGWTKKTTIPTIRIAASAQVINGKIYIIGGNGGPPSFSNLAVNEIYDPLANKWEKKLPMPTPRGFFASGLVRDTIYACGGGYSSGSITVEAYDPATDTWSTKANMLNPRFCMRAAVVDGIIYILGGNYNEHNCQAYDPATNKWAERTPIPSGGGGNLSVTSYNGLIYTFGGSSNSSYNEPWVALSTVYEYDPKTDLWTKKKDMPTPRFGFQTYLVNGKIYAIGGSQARNTSLATVEVYDPVANTWETKPNMPFNSFVFAGAVVDTMIYVISGSPDWATSDGAIWEYDPAYYLNIYAQNLYVDKLYTRINIDSVLFRTKFSNIYNHQFTPHLIYSDINNTQIDSLSLFDDGLHGDSLADDGLYGEYIPPRQTEDYFTLSVSTIDNQTNKYFSTADMARFTTAGPINLDSIIFLKGITNYYNLRPFVRSEGSSLTITNAKIQLKCNDPWVSAIGTGALNLPNIAPGVSAGASSWIAISYFDEIFPGYFNLKAEISVDGWTYWTDSIRINVITGLEEEALLPSAFKLEQNFPNPFNNSSAIKYSLPNSLKVIIKVFNVLGNEIETLVNEEKSAGYHSIDFNASDLPSGVYFYRIMAVNPESSSGQVFFNTIKMILLK